MNATPLGTVPYLNAKPLVAWLEDHRADHPLIEAVPSRLAELLARREVSAALVSSVIPLSDPALCTLNAGAVTSDGPVRSIRLMSRMPVREIRRLALDSSSRTAAILCQVLLQKVYGLRPEVVSLAPNVSDMLETADAGLVIGDPALLASVQMERGELPQVAADIDLGSLWKAETGLPFVYAVWATPRGGDLPGMKAVLAESTAWGLAHKHEIAERGAERLGLPMELCTTYITENIRYEFGPREWEGLRTFHRYAVEYGLLRARPIPLECPDERSFTPIK